MLATAAAIFSVLLIVTGATKLARPHDVTKALVDLGLPRIPGAGVLIGAAEVVVGVGSFILPALLLAQAVAYLAFAAWVFLALRADVPVASCGCLGRDDTPPTVAHIILNVVAAVSSFGASFGEGLDVSTPLEATAHVSVISVGVLLAYVVLNHFSRLSGVRRG